MSMVIIVFQGITVYLLCPLYTQTGPVHKGYDMQYLNMKQKDSLYIVLLDDETQHYIHLPDLLSVYRDMDPRRTQDL